MKVGKKRPMQEETTNIPRCLQKIVAQLAVESDKKTEKAFD